ncbi:MAG: hypothetical protein E6Q97_02295 [Desulfurellales bacterium]|nr:MAG: hypothetical protein E6Q97_02295 [Desulfurellales bacterium]
MALRNISLLISQAREETGETDYSESGTEINGVPQSVPLQAAREGVIHCQNVLYLADPKIFDVIGYIDGVQSQLEYDLPANAFLGAAIASAEYSQSGADNSYQRLSFTDYSYRSGGTGTPSRFISYGDGKFLVDPPCSTAGGKFRIVYGATLDVPALRCGKIEARTLNGGGTLYETVVLENDSNLNEVDLAANEYFCVNDKDGVVKYYNVDYTAYDSGTKTLTLGSSVAVTGGTIAVGDYITIGRYSTSHIKLHAVAEPIILAFMRRRFYLGKSSADVQGEEDNIAAFTKEAVSVYRRRVRTAKKIPFTGRFENLGRRL